MKPKERFYGYALLPNCDRNASAVKDDSPIDLSTKRQHSPLVHSLSPFAAIAASDFEPHSIDHSIDHPIDKTIDHSIDHPLGPSLAYSDWSAKYLLSSSAARNVQLQTNPNLLPYLLLNRTCLDVSSAVADAAIALKNHKTDIIYDQFGNPYSVGADHSVIALRSPYFDLYKTNAIKRSAQNGSHISSPNTSSSNSSTPSTNSTNNSHEFSETKRLLERSPTNSSVSNISDAMRTNRSHKHSLHLKSASNLIRSMSFPLITAIKSSVTSGRKVDSPTRTALTPLTRSKSESSLHYLNFDKYERKVSYKPKSMAIFRYSNGENIERIADKIRKNSQQKEDYKQYLRCNAKQHIMDSDNEKEDLIESGVSDDYGSDDALDLRVGQALPTKLRGDLTHSDPEHLFHQINHFLNQGSSPAANPLDVYRQYYYYLMNQPALASRAVAAVAVAETYAKLLSGAHHNHNETIDGHNSDICDNNTSIYESENQSPDYLLSGSRAELRSADTTNNGIPFDRKRISRPLTGKHVRHGTGASPSTLVSLRNMIQQRQRLKDIGAIDANKLAKGKSGKRVKRK